MTGYIIQVPVLFDMSGDTLVYGEDGTQSDFIANHLEFNLDMTNDVDISLNASHFQYAIRVGDQDDTENLFYGNAHHESLKGAAEIDLLANRMAKAITRGKLIHVSKNGNTSNTGIPMGGRSLRNQNGVVDPTPQFNIYAPKYFHSVAPVGDEQMLGDLMGRIACVHLVGHPLSASIFVDDTSIQNYLETPTSNSFQACHHGSAEPITTYYYNQIAEQLSKVIGGNLSDTPLEASGDDHHPVLDASGHSIPALKSVLEQLLTIPGRAKYMIESRDVSGERDPNEPHKDISGLTHTGPFPILSGDKLVVYIRPKIEFSADTVAQFQSTLQGWQVPGTPLVTPYSFAAGTAHTNGVNRNQHYNNSGVYNPGFTHEGRNAWGDGGAGGTTNWQTEFNGVHSTTPGYLEDGTYNTAGANDQSTPTTLGPYAGEWTQVRMPEKYALTRVVIKPIYYNPTQQTQRINPTHFALLGTNEDPANGQDWNIIKIWSDVNSTNTWYYNNQNTDLTVNFDGTLHHYKYWRFVINKRQISDISMNTGIESINMYGVKQTEIAGSYSTQQPTAEAVDISGLITNVVSQGTKVYNAFPGKDFPGDKAEENKWCWMGSGVSDSLTLETTDEKNTSTIDLHVWKITIQL